MKNISIISAAAAIVAVAAPTTASAQYLHGGGHAGEPVLHTSNRWKECSFQLDPSLTKDAWKQFTREAGMVVYFRPLTDARPMGKGSFEVSMLQWKTGINDSDAAWNDTFVHPEADHWLFEGSGLSFPGLTARAGVADGTDVGVFWTRNPNANYGVYGAQLQQSLVRGDDAVAARVSFSSLYGPDDVGFNVTGLDLVGSKAFAVSSRVSFSPYVGVSGYLTRSFERSAVVSLANESALGVQGMAGATLSGYGVRLAMEYNVAEVNSVSMKIGFGR